MFFRKNKRADSADIPLKVHKNLGNEEPNEFRTDMALLKHNQKCIIGKMGNSIEETGFAVENLINITDIIAAKVEEQMEAINNVVDEISNYSALAQEVYASAEESRGISEETAGTAQEGSGAVNDSLQAMDGIKDSVQEAEEVVNILASKASNINAMLNVIKDIANNTNLLALNASIEAARAGEAGRGFAVVAGEVRKLSDRSLESVNEITEIIKEINMSIDTTRKAMANIMDRVDIGNRIAHNTMDVFNRIIEAVQNNAIVSKEIADAIRKQTQSLENIIKQASDMSKTFNDLASMVETASLNTQYTRNSLNYMSRVSEDLVGLNNKLLQAIEDKGKEETILRTCLPYDFKVYDPILLNDAVGTHIMVNVHSGLLTTGTSGEIRPGVAKSWYLKEDNLTWVFNLRKGAKFHNGNEITAEDVKFSLERLLNPKYNSPTKWALEWVEGADEYSKGLSKDVKGIKILDKYCISIKLIKPYSGFLLNLGQFFCGIVDKEGIERGEIIGCGPYRIEKADSEECVLSAFADYFGGTPYVDKIIVKFVPENAAEELKCGNLDFVLIDDKATMEKVRSSENVNCFTQNMAATYYVGFNLKSGSPLIKNKEARRAINMAVNKKRIIDELLGEMAVESQGPIPPGLLEKRTAKGYTYDAEEARKILDRLGISDNARKLVILAREENDTSIYNRIGNYIIEDLERIGIQCTMVRVPHLKYLERQSLDKCDLFISRWVADIYDPDNFLEPLFNPESFNNFTLYNNNWVTEKIKEGKTIINPAKRMALYSEIEKVIVEDAPWIFLYHPRVGVAYRKELLGVRLGPMGHIKYEDIIIDSSK